jgi:hypothetical protein
MPVRSFTGPMRVSTTSLDKLGVTFLGSGLVCFVLLALIR